MSFNIITAIFRNGGMGKRGDLPWDLAGTYSSFFSKLTIGDRNNAVIMGSTTFDDMMCYKYFPLSNRQNLVMSTKTPSKSNLTSSGVVCMDHSLSCSIRRLASI